MGADHPVAPAGAPAAPVDTRRAKDRQPVARLRRGARSKLVLPALREPSRTSPALLSAGVLRTLRPKIATLSLANPLAVTTRVPSSENTAELTLSEWPNCGISITPRTLGADSVERRMPLP